MGAPAAHSSDLDARGLLVIDEREILELAAQTSLTPHVVEKDHAR
jgi:predicted pyridoxine 5'-phosphate oxidase superfamily flavin-nucleotide-binding protein